MRDAGKANRSIPKRQKMAAMLQVAVVGRARGIAVLEKTGQM
jgi:hypothetical protein